MRSASWIAGLLASLTATCGAELNHSAPLISKTILPSSFIPPQTFRNLNLVRNINLDKAFSRETINVVIENIDSEPQYEYYLPFETETISKIGGFEARDKKDADKAPYKADVVALDSDSATEYYRIQLSDPVQPKQQHTLSISYNIVSVLKPVPAAINQADKQYVQYTFSAYTPSAYTTLKQKTKLKLPTSDIPDYTVLPSPNADKQKDPQVQGTAVTYGPYDSIPAGSVQLVSLRYEFTKPLIHATLLERDLEISHWGGNLATEERYWLENQGAHLKGQFSRVNWVKQQYYNPATAALRELKIPLHGGSTDAYFIDDIGNVSTSRFRSNDREANLELRPRYPVFGGWKYSFRVGWNADLKDYLRKGKSGDEYVLKVPFLEGPKQPEGMSYDRVDLRVILPEGAKNVRFETTVPIISSSVSLHRTYMDTVGRTTLKLTAWKVIDDLRDIDLIVVYDYPWTAGFRKPLTIFAGVFTVFVTAWVLGNLDMRIGKKRQ